MDLLISLTQQTKASDVTILFHTDNSMSHQKELKAEEDVGKVLNQEMI
jgi:hypothetical protein